MVAEITSRPTKSSLDKNSTMNREHCRCGVPGSALPVNRILGSGGTMHALLAGYDIEDWTSADFISAFRLDVRAEVVIQDEWAHTWKDLGKTLGCVITQNYDALPHEKQLLIRGQLELSIDE